MADEKKDVIVSEADDHTVIMTFADKVAEQRYKEAVASYDPRNRLYSAYLNESGSANTLTQSYITQLGKDAQSSLTNIQSINAIIRQYVNTDDLVGMVV